MQAAKAVVDLSSGIKEQNSDFAYSNNPLGRFSDKPKVIKYKWEKNG